MRKILFAGALGVLAMAQPMAAAQTQPAARPAAQAGVPHTVRGELKLYEDLNYNGDDWTIDSNSPTVHTDWNIRSIAIHPGDRWQICARSRYRDPCIILNRSVHDASLIGVEGQIGSARPAPGPVTAPAGN